MLPLDKENVHLTHQHAASLFDGAHSEQCCSSKMQCPGEVSFDMVQYFATTDSVCW
jgi:hypothetical protein